MEVGYQRRQRTHSLVFSPNASFKQAYVIVLCVMRHNTNSRMVIQITKNKEDVLQSVYSHAHVALARSYLIVSLAGQILRQAKQRKGR